MLPKTQNKARVNIYIDGANLKKGVLRLGDEIDYAKFFEWLRKKYKPDNVSIFLGYIHSLEVEYKYLEELGYKIIFKETYFEENILKANCDAELILNCITDHFGDKFDQAILISGDGDYNCLVKFLLDKNKFKTLIAPNYKQCSIFLKRTFNSIIFIENPNIRRIVCKNLNQNEKAPE